MADEAFTVWTVRREAVCITADRNHSWRKSTLNSGSAQIAKPRKSALPGFGGDAEVALLGVLDADDADREEKDESDLAESVSP